MEVRYFEFEGGRSPVEDFIDGLGSKQQSKAFAYMGMLKRADSTLRMPTREA